MGVGPFLQAGDSERRAVRVCLVVGNWFLPAPFQSWATTDSRDLITGGSVLSPANSRKPPGGAVL